VPDLQVNSEVDCVIEQQIELQSRQLWSLTQFWVVVQTMEPNLSDLCRKTTKAFFPTTYRCEAGFPRYNYF